MKQKYQITLLIVSILALSIIGLHINNILLATEKTNSKSDNQKRLKVPGNSLVHLKLVVFSRGLAPQIW